MKRSAYLRYDEMITIGKRGLTVWAYGRNRKYVCRLEINATGITVFAGKKGGKRLANKTWEAFINLLEASPTHGPPA